MKSLSEIETTSKRASRAAGFSWGVSEEIAKSIRLLELCSLAGIKNLNDYYKSRNNNKFENLVTINESNSSEKHPYCPLILGVSFLDQIEKIEKIKTISFSKIAYPLLFLPFLSRSSEVIGKKIFFKFEKSEFLLNINVNISTNLLDKNCPNIATNAEVKILENIDNFTENDWKSLYQLSEKTFVEESESLKKGAAGAGLTDND